MKLKPLLGLFLLVALCNVAKSQIISNSAKNYAENSVLSNGGWYQFAVDQDGIYKLDYEFITSDLGASLSGVSFSNVGIFGNGGGMIPEENADARPDDLLENAFQKVDLNGNNVFEPGDYLLIYAEGPDNWLYDENTGRFAHQKNLYSNQSFYYFTPNRGSGKEVPLQSSAPSANLVVTSFDDYAFHEEEGENLLGSGRIWLGELFTAAVTTRTFDFVFPNMLTNEPVFLESSVVGRSVGSSSIFNISSNNQNILNQTIGSVVDGYALLYAQDSESATTFTSNSGSISLKYDYSSGPSTRQGWLNFIRLNVKRSLQFTGSFMDFRSVESVGPGNITEFRLQNANNNTRILDITDPANTMEIQGALSGNQLNFKVATDELKAFAAYSTSGPFQVPTALGQIPNQNLHGLASAFPDMLIISHELFLDEAETLANFHRTHSGLSVEVVDVKLIYHEFGSGKKDISAIRDFVKMFYDKAGTDEDKKPQYLLLFGDGSYDYKDRIADNTNYIPAYESKSSFNPTSTYVSDDFYGFLDDNEGGSLTNGDKLDIAIGRLPVKTSQEAQGVVAKILHYASTKTFGNWRNIVSFVADDEDGSIHLRDADDVTDWISQNHPIYNLDKIYLDAYPQQNTSAGDRYPAVNLAIEKRLFSGSLIMNYTGHGGVNNWAHERIFDVNDIQQLENLDNLPLFVTATCEFSRFDDPATTSAGELLLLSNKGGAIGLVTTVRLVYSSQNKVLSDAFYHQVFELHEGRTPTMGEVIMKAKNSINGDSNNRKFTLLGDPALKLAYPKYNIVTTEVLDAEGETADTISALSLVTFKGEVRDQNNQKVELFEGVLYPTIYDKVQEIQTLSNDPGSPKRTFDLQKNALFKGKASIENGSFSFSFIVPKDIDYSYGFGKVSYYADNGETDANGFRNDLTIGGSFDGFAADNEGPDIDLFMNDEFFINGGVTDANPLLLVKLEDESGINTTGNGIGHDLTAVLNENYQQKIILNEFYEGGLDDFRKGEIKYPLSDLPDGWHQIKVKAWDVHNNASEQYLAFHVVSSEQLALEDVFNYPNPFSNSTTFQFEHNMPDEPMTAIIEVFNASGVLVKAMEERLVPGGYRETSIAWDGTNDDGAALHKGVYVYKVTILTMDGLSDYKFDKLVILR